MKLSKNENTCFQYIKKLENKKQDEIDFKLEEGRKLSISDLNFEVIYKTDNTRVKEVVSFIERYEWLGKINNYWNYSFALTYENKLVAVIMVGTPSTFSKILGPKTMQLEQNIHRGASCYIAPKNAGSFLISKAINFLVKETPYRLFSGYSTPTGASELGIIYQSLNFVLYTNKAGRRQEFLKPGTGNEWICDRVLRKQTNYKRIAKRLGFTWQKNWNEKWKIHWENMPKGVEEEIKREQKEEMKKYTFRKVEPKLKYILIKGKNKRETKQLNNLFKEHNPKLMNNDGSIGLPYPKRKHVCKNVASQNLEVENNDNIQ